MGCCRCGHCKELAPKYREAAAILEAADLPRPVVLAKYDDSTDSQRRLRAGAEDVFNFNAYPALYIFEDGKHRPYTGGRNTNDIVTFMTAVSKGLDPHLEEKKAAPGLYKNLPDYDPKVFLDLDPESFKSVVLADMQVALDLHFLDLRLPYLHSHTPAHGLTHARSNVKPRSRSRRLK